MTGPARRDVADLVADLGDLELGESLELDLALETAAESFAGR